jgi:hypothetical protein
LQRTKETKRIDRDVCSVTGLRSLSYAGRPLIYRSKAYVARGTRTRKGARRKKHTREREITRTRTREEKRQDLATPSRRASSSFASEFCSGEQHHIHPSCLSICIEILRTINAILSPTKIQDNRCDAAASMATIMGPGGKRVFDGKQ